MPASRPCSGLFEKACSFSRASSLTILDMAAFGGASHLQRIAAAAAPTQGIVPPLVVVRPNTARGRSGSAPGGGTGATAWVAAGGDDDPMPRLVDLDHAVTSTNTFSKQGRYFCSLPWGSRCGLCKGNQTSCELAAFAQRSFCAPAGAKADAKAGGGKGKVPRARAEAEAEASNW